METQSVKQKILKGEMTDEELSGLLNGKNNNAHSHRQGGSFLKTILKGFIEGYTAPNMWRLTLEAILILVVILGIVILSYTGRIDSIITSVLLSFVLGFLFGKIK
jgi:hypothetical protein